MDRHLLLTSVLLALAESMHPAPRALSGGAPSATAAGFPLPLPVWVINLDSRLDRWASIQAAFHPYADLVQLRRHPAISHGSGGFLAADGSFAALSNGCTASHLQLASVVPDDADFVIVLEDDARPGPSFAALPSLLAAAARSSEWDVLNLGAATLTSTPTLRFKELVFSPRGADENGRPLFFSTSSSISTVGVVYSARFAARGWPAALAATAAAHTLGSMFSAIDVLISNAPELVKWQPAVPLVYQSPSDTSNVVAGASNAGVLPFFWAAAVDVANVASAAAAAAAAATAGADASENREPSQSINCLPTHELDAPVQSFMRGQRLVAFSCRPQGRQGSTTAPPPPFTIGSMPHTQQLAPEVVPLAMILGQEPLISSLLRAGGRGCVFPPPPRAAATAAFSSSRVFEVVDIITTSLRDSLSWSWETAPTCYNHSTAVDVGIAVVPVTGEGATVSAAAAQTAARCSGCPALLLLVETLEARAVGSDFVAIEAESCPGGAYVQVLPPAASAAEGVLPSPGGAAVHRLMLWEQS